MIIHAISEVAAQMVARTGSPAGCQRRVRQGPD